MTDSNGDFRIAVVFGYFYARTMENYYDQTLLQAKLDEAKLHCLNTKQQRLLVLFSVIHAELFEDSLNSNSPTRRFLSEQIPSAAQWYDKIVSATTRGHHFEVHGQELQLLGSSREHNLTRICRAVDDEEGNLIAAIIAGVNRTPFHRILKAAKVEV